MPALSLLLISTQNHNFSMTKDVSSETSSFPRCLRCERQVCTKEFRGLGVVRYLCKSSEAEDEGFFTLGGLLDCSIFQSTLKPAAGKNLYNFIKMSFLIVLPSCLFLNGVTQIVTALIILYGCTCFL